MTPRESAVFGVTSKNVTGLAIAFLVLAAFFGFLNSQKMKVLRANAANAQAVRDAAERRKAWDDILTINAEQVFSIGTVNSVRQPLTAGKKVKNLPEKGYWAWDPGGYIGLYKPDTFWIS